MTSSFTIMSFFSFMLFLMLLTAISVEGAPLTLRQCDLLVRAHPLVQTRYIGTSRMRTYDSLVDKCVDVFMDSFAPEEAVNLYEEENANNM
jgi:hypothetical protein